MNKRRTMLLGGILALLSIFAVACGQEESKSKFESTEYRIFANETKDKLNIEEPHYIHSLDTSIVTAQIGESGDIIITSIGQGNTAVYVGDSVGLSNSARIQLSVGTSGKIDDIRINEFDGRRVVPTVKQAVIISGTVGSPISPREINLQMNGTHFIVTYDMEVTSWIKNMSIGLSAKISDIIVVDNPDHPHELYIEVSGTPLSASSEVFDITIPGENAGRGWDVYVIHRDNAKFDIVQ